jgi:hypothetical protein
MKKILFVALGATLLAAGCQKTEIMNQVNPDGKSAMTFSTGISKLTKSATATGEQNLQGQGFVLTAIRAYEDIYSDTDEFNDYYDDLNNAPFAYTPGTGSNDGTWAIVSGQSYFWPGKERDLVFFAVSSAQKDGNKQKYANPEIADNAFGITGAPIDGKEGIYGEVQVNNYVIPEYTVVAPTYEKETSDNKTIGAQTGADDDLMVADVVLMNQDDVASNGTKGQVDLKFNHTLSKVEFVFSTNEATADKYIVEVQSVVVEEVVTKADLNIAVNFANTEEADNVYDWDTTQDASYVEKATATNSATYTIDYKLQLTAAEQSYATWLVIPQSLKDKMVTITYTIDDASKTTDEVKTYTSVWPLASTTAQINAWEINNYVRYKVNLSPNLITFNPVLENDWNPAVSVDPSTGTEVNDTPAPVEPTYTELKATSGETEVILYYEGTLAVDTVILVKNENVYIPAAEGDYLLENGSTLKVGAEGKVTEIVPPTPAN